jgi:hypothetical protein
MQHAVHAVHAAHAACTNAHAHLVERGLHRQLGRVARVHAAAKGLDEALKHLGAEVAADKLLDRLLVGCVGFLVFLLLLGWFLGGGGVFLMCVLTTSEAAQTAQQRKKAASAPPPPNQRIEKTQRDAPGMVPLAMPTAPRPARILPHKVMRSKVSASGPLGVGRSLFSQKTKRGAVGSPNTSWSCTPASTCLFVVLIFGLVGDL